jgi:hypothetical protein
MDLSIGRWAVMPGYGGRLAANEYDLIQITKVTEKLVKGQPGWGTHDRQFPKDAVMATFATQDEAKRLISKIAGIRGEHDSRVQAAKKSANDALDRLLGATTPA